MKRFIGLCILLLSIMGCSSDSIFQGSAENSTRDATITDASQSLDDGDYDSVISSLTSLYDTTNPDPEVACLLGSAYMGKAGIDVTNLIAFGDDTESDPFDMVAATLSLAVEGPITNDTFTDTDVCDVDTLTVLMPTDGGQYIDGHCDDAIITYLSKALRIFDLLVIHGRDTDDSLILRGIASSVHITLLLGSSTADALNTTLLSSNPAPGSVPVPLNKRSYELFRTGAPWNINYQLNWGRISTHAFYTTIPLEYYQDDLKRINNAIIAFDRMIATPDPVRDDLDSFLRAFLQEPVAEIDDTLIYSMTTTDITSYINDVLSVE